MGRFWLPYRATLHLSSVCSIRDPKSCRWCQPQQPQPTKTSWVQLNVPSKKQSRPFLFAISNKFWIEPEATVSTTANISEKNSDWLNTGMVMFLIFTEDRTRTLPIQMWALEILCCACIKGWRQCSIGQLRARKLSVTNYGTGTCQMKNSTWRRNCSLLTTPCNELNHKTLPFQLIIIVLHVFFIVSLAANPIHDVISQSICKGILLWFQWRDWNIGLMKG